MRFFKQSRSSGKQALQDAYEEGFRHGFEAAKIRLYEVPRQDWPQTEPLIERVGRPA